MFYISYENDDSKSGTSKYRFLLHELEMINPIDEEHGILRRDDIVKVCSDIFDGYDVSFCYLFGS